MSFLLDWLRSNWPWVVLFFVLWIFFLRKLKNGSLGLMFASELDALKDEHGRLPPVRHGKGFRKLRPTPVILAGHHGDIPYECRAHQEQGDERTSFVMTLRAASPGEVFVHRRLSSTSLVGLAGRLLRPVTETSAPGLDSEFVVLSDGSEDLAAVLRDPAVQEDIREIYRLGFTHIRKDALGIDLIWFDAPSVADRPMRVVPDALGHAAKILSRFRQIRRSGTRLNPQTRGMLAIMLPVALLLLAQAANHFPHDPLNTEYGSLVVRVLPWAAMLAAILPVVQWRLLRGGCRIRWATLLMMGLSIPVAWLVTISVAVYVNGAWDTGSPQLRGPFAVAVGAPDEDGSCAVEVPSWRDAHQSERIFLPRGIGEEIARRQAVDQTWPPFVVYTRPGWLGVEWIERFELVEERDSDPAPRSSLQRE